MNKKSISKLLHYAKYLLAGGATTIISFLSYWILYDKIGIDVSIANILSVIIAILFSFFVNRYFVFGSDEKSYVTFMNELAKFISSRILAMFVEVYGVIILIKLNFGPMESKIIISFFVVILNYLFSRFFVFKKSTI